MNQARRFVAVHDAAIGVVLILVLWVMGQVLIGEPTLEPAGLRPARYRVLDPVVAEMTVAKAATPRSSSGPEFTAGSVPVVSATRSLGVRP